MGLIAYGLIALAILGALGGIGYKVRQAGADSVRAELQPKLTACEGQVATMGGQIKAQNEAVDALQDESARRLATSAQAARKADDRARVWDEQAKRLQVVLTSRKLDGDKSCAAAWAEIRK